MYKIVNWNPYFHLKLRIKLGGQNMENIQVSTKEIDISRLFFDIRCRTSCQGWNSTIQSLPFLANKQGNGHWNNRLLFLGVFFCSKWAQRCKIGTYNKSQYCKEPFFAQNDVHITYI